MHHSLKTARLLLSEAGFFVLLILMMAPLCFSLLSLIMGITADRMMRSCRVAQEFLLRVQGDK